MVQLQVVQLQLRMQRASMGRPAHQQPLPAGAQRPLQRLLRIDTTLDQYFEAVAACRSVPGRPGSAIGLLFVHLVTSEAFRLLGHLDLVSGRRARCKACHESKGHKESRAIHFEGRWTVPALVV
jgi:hypothetical protein